MVIPALAPTIDKSLKAGSSHAQVEPWNTICIGPQAEQRVSLCFKEVSLEQLLLACHWKSHNSFTQFYLKDVAWADSELIHLGPVVAA